MHKRWLYALLFAIPGFVAAFIVTTFLFGMAAGFLWLYVYGDGPWPQVPDVVVGAALSVVFLTLWFASIMAGYVTGRDREGSPENVSRAALISAGATLLLVLFVVLQHRGSRPDSLVCSEYCRGRGYNTSEMPPADSGQRLCDCLNSNGERVDSVDMDRLTGE